MGINKWVKMAEELGKKHGRDIWADKLAKFIAAWKKHEADRGAEARPTWRTPQEWVTESVSITAANGGALPSTNWLNKNGYSGLVAAKRKRPELFGDSTTESNQ